MTTRHKELGVSVTWNNESGIPEFKFKSLLFQIFQMKSEIDSKKIHDSSRVMFEFKCLPFKAFKFKCLKVKTLSSVQMLRTPNLNSNVNSDFSMESFHPRGQHLCKFIETKENVSIRKEFNSHRIGLVHQHGCRFIVLEHHHAVTSCENAL